MTLRNTQETLFGQLDRSRRAQRPESHQPDLRARVLAWPSIPGADRKSIRHESEVFDIVDSTSVGARTVIVAEQPARVRLTKWHLGGQHQDRVLTMARMLFFVTFFRGGFENLYAYFLRSRYAGTLTALYHSILPNSDRSGWVCMGRDATRDELTLRTLAQSTWDTRVATILAAFWQDTYFNSDLMSRFSDHGPKLHRDLASLAAWERASRRRPGFIHEVPWEFAGFAYDILDKAGRRR